MGSIRTSRARPSGARSRTRSRSRTRRRTPSGRAIRRSERRRFLNTVIGFAVLFGAIGVTWGEDIALELQKSPTTTTGWLLIGWLIAGPPYLVTILCWHERSRFDRRQRRNLTYLLSAWIGSSMLILPARIRGVDDQFGTAALVGDPLSIGWAWGALANLVAFAFSAIVLTVLYRSVPGRPTTDQRDLTIRFLERAWLVALAVSLGFALYGRDSGIFNSGT